MNISNLDIKSLKGVDSLFRFLVVQDGFLLAGDDLKYQSFNAFAFRDYVDSAGLRDLELKMIQHKQKKIEERYPHD